MALGEAIKKCIVT